MPLSLTRTPHSSCTGMCIEKSKPEESVEALTMYLTAVVSIPSLEAEITRSSPANPAPTSTAGPVRLQYTSFTCYRELWRWIEFVLWRSIVLSSRIYPLGSPEESLLWTLLGQYQNCSAHWPPTFRPTHRSTVATLHLRALVLKSRLNPRRPLDGRAAWVTDARRVVREFRDVLSATTHFPRANERNVRVEELVDLTMAVWEAAGESGMQSGWVMDVRR